MTRARFRIKDNRPEFLRQFRSGISRNVSNAAAIAISGVRERLRGPRSGEEYRVPGTRRYYTASAPGEAPARRTGTLARSYRPDVEQADEGRASIGSELEYAPMLERGTKRMAARPHFWVGVADKTNMIRRALARPVV